MKFKHWKLEFGPIDQNEPKSLKELKREDAVLKKVLADSILAQRALEYSIKDNCASEGKTGREGGRNGRCVLRAGRMRWSPETGQAGSLSPNQKYDPENVHETTSA